MKKVFLSLATIAFVAVGSLTMTSCGSDDSTTNPGGENPGGENPGGENPGGENPGEVTKGFSVGGEVYLLDNFESQVRSNADRTAIEVLDVTLSDQSTVRATRWLMVAYSGNDPMEALNYHQSTIYIPVGAGDVVVSPAEAESFIIGGFGVYAGNATQSLDLGNISQVSLGFQTYVEGTEASLGSVAYSNKFTSSNKGVVEMVFIGDMDGTYLVPAQSAKGSTSVQSRITSSTVKTKVEDLSKLDTYYGGRVTLQDGKIIKK